MTLLYRLQYLLVNLARFMPHTDMFQAPADRLWQQTSTRHSTKK